MKKSDVLAYLKMHQDARGIANWESSKGASGGLNSYGIGLTKLRKFAKTVGTDPKLARTLWKSNVDEMKVIALLIDDPKTMTVEPHFELPMPRREATVGGCIGPRRALAGGRTDSGTTAAYFAPRARRALADAHELRGV
jgi:hypothetical protein